MTKQRAEELLDEWCTAGYLYISNGDSVTLGPRGIGEYRDILRTKFGDHIQSCHLCNEIVLQVNSWNFGQFFHRFHSKCSLSAVALFKRCMRNFTGQTMLQKLRVEEEEVPSMQSQLGRSLMQAKQSKNTLRIPVFSFGGKKKKQSLDFKRFQISQIKSFIHSSYQ